MSSKKKYLSDRIADLAKAVAFHDLAYGDAPVISNVQDNKAEHMSLSTIVLNLEELAGYIQESCDWTEMRDQIWDEVTFDEDIKPEIFKDIASEPQLRIIKLDSFMAESEFDELLTDFKSRHMGTQITGADIWQL